MPTKTDRRSSAAGLYIASREERKMPKSTMLAQAGERIVKPYPYVGTVSRAVARSAVAEVINARKK